MILGVFNDVFSICVWMSKLTISRHCLKTGSFFKAQLGEYLTLQWSEGYVIRVKSWLSQIEMVKWLFYCIACVSSAMLIGQLRTCKSKAKSHIINNLLTSNVRSLRENIWIRTYIAIVRSVRHGSWFAEFSRKDLTIGW